MTEKKSKKKEAEVVEASVDDAMLEETPIPADEITAPRAVASGPSPQKYRVTKGGKIMMGGCITRLPVGEILDEASYGKVGIARILEQKIELEPIK